MLIPADPTECFEMAGTVLDLAERLQTPVFVLSDLDIGMNRWITKEFQYPEKPLDRGKVLDAEELAKFKDEHNGQRWGRYLDVDGDGIPYRTLPGTDNPAAAYFTWWHRPHRVRHLQRASDGSGEEHQPAGAQVRDGAHPRAGADHRRGGKRHDRHHQHGQQPPGGGRGVRPPA